MSEEWQLEAVHEQFDVFNSLTTPYENIEGSDFEKICRVVQEIVRKHLRVETKTNSSRKVIAKIVENTEDQNIKLSFIVIVTNQYVNEVLCKIPVFIIKTGNKCVFIDMNCTAYYSWDAFMKSNDLPPCIFCFPLNGCYNVGGRLKIEFAKSPAQSFSSFKRVCVIGGGLVIIGVIVASFFFTIPPVVLKCAQPLIPLADALLSGIGKCLIRVISLVKLIQNLKSGNIHIIEFSAHVCKIIQWFLSEYEQEISAVYKKVAETLKKVYDYISSLFSKVFETASDSSRHQFLAVTSRVDSELWNLQAEAEMQLNDTRRNNEQFQNSGDSTSHSNTSEESDRYVQQIFNNCKEQCAMNSAMKDKEDDNLSQTTKELLTISNNVANRLQCNTLNEVQDIFESLSYIVQAEYQHKIRNYTNMVRCAEVAAGHKIDLKVFNDCLGIEGDPKNHYWREAVKCMGELRLTLRIQQKIEELQMQKKILMLPFWKKSEDDFAGVYRIVGVPGVGKFTVHNFLNVLKENAIHLNENNLVINETSSQIIILCEELTIVAQQHLNVDNTSEGLVYIDRLDIEG